MENRQELIEEIFAELKEILTDSTQLQTFDRCCFSNDAKERIELLQEALKKINGLIEKYRIN